MKIKDIVQDSSVNDIHQNFENYKYRIHEQLEKIKTLKRTDKNLSLFNVLRKVLSYIDCLQFGLNGPIEVTASSARSLFELNLVLRYVLINEENLMRYILLSGIERKELFEALLNYSDKSNEDVNELNNEIDRLNKILANKPKKKLPNWKQLSKQFNLEQEYDFIYKLFCAFVHPSSYSVNGDVDTNELYFRNILLIYTQLYIADIFERIDKELFPEID
jgi:hypothetical protein